MGGLLYVCDNEKNYQIAESGAASIKAPAFLKEMG